MAEDDVYTKDGTVDYLGNPANKKETGTWRACPFILGNYGVCSNETVVWWDIYDMLIISRLYLQEMNVVRDWLIMG